ncbi:hypothetical protein ACVIWV_005791 [Bradyrhizobium diazoefficiens]|uniref:DUF7768 domain-containing protein n=1 Tax=Bradyrhizobium diazoefficiens TaxID=1355477 RepID=UPI000765DBBB|nr:hypothetical protein [Bradyrhizobium diazoefficiens]MBR0863659.1 hypothetical protein [Bradyrhizobium diazoefficiens]MBR0888289.1 hypothetical protein [Bradyrhizobium diazoefficiens]MBR0920051.1 hypothetical protein [Bradyrhizobium diazoefficiens]
MQSIKLVVLESPYAGAVDDNVAYARRCLKDCALRGESAQASHLLLTQVLDDTKPDERALGIALGLAWRSVAAYSVFYTDRGWSNGMRAALDSAILENRPFKLRAFGRVQFPSRYFLPLNIYEAIDQTKAPAHA